MLARFSLFLVATATLAQTPCAELTSLRIPDLIMEEAKTEPAKTPFPQHGLVHSITLTLSARWRIRSNRARLPAKGAACPGVSPHLCLFPAIPRYKGSGSTDAAANFACQATR